MATYGNFSAITHTHSNSQWWKSGYHGEMGQVLFDLGLFTLIAMKLCFIAGKPEVSQVD